MVATRKPKKRGIQGRKPIPKKTRAAVYARCKHCCEDCGLFGPLELHHLRYWEDLRAHPKYMVSILGKETPEDLLALCRQCHYGRHIHPHTGEYFLIPEELEEELAYISHMSRD